MVGRWYALCVGLAGFKEYQRHLKAGVWHRKFGFHGKAGDVNQLAARMGVAKSLGVIELSNHKQETALAYSSIFRVFLSYSAFEIFYYLVHGGDKCRPSQAEPWSLARSPEVVTKLLREKRGERLVQFLVGELVPPAAKSLRDVREGRSDNVLYLAAAIRHIFAHGAMTAHSYGTTPAYVKKLGDATSAHVLRIVDEEFSARVAAFSPSASQNESTSEVSESA